MWVKLLHGAQQVLQLSFHSLIFCSHSSNCNCCAFTGPLSLYIHSHIPNCRIHCWLYFTYFILSYFQWGSTTLDRKRMYANPSSYPNSNCNLNPNVQLCFRTDEMTSFFDQVHDTFQWWCILFCALQCCSITNCRGWLFVCLLVSKQEHTGTYTNLKMKKKRTIFSFIFRDKITVRFLNYIIIAV